MLYVNYRVSGEWITFYYGFFGNPRNTRERNTARQKGNKMLSLMGPLAAEEEGKAKLMEERDFINNGEHFFGKAVTIARELPYNHPDNEVMRELSHTLHKSAVILQRARINYCSGGSKITDSDLDNLAGNIEMR